MPPPIWLWLVWLCCAGTTVSLALSLYMLQRYVLFYEGKVRWYRINETFHQPVSTVSKSSSSSHTWQTAGVGGHSTDDAGPT